MAQVSIALQMVLQLENVEYQMKEAANRAFRPMLTTAILGVFRFLARLLR